jgi:hypothetical protein
MSYTPLTPQQPTDGSDAINPNLALSEVASDSVNGNSFPLTGHEVLLLRNTDTSDHHVTISSAPDPLGRTSDIESYDIPSGTTAVISFLGLTGISGWVQDDGNLYFQTDSNTIKASVLYVGF